jgi:signal transduction histidine kinase
MSQQGDILIVDDTPANLRLLADMLTGQGYTVRVARNGELALRGVRAAPPDLILLDIKMPELDGYAVCAQLKADPGTRDIPVIFISALDQVEDKVQAFTHGGVDYVTKPFQMAEVLARVETHLNLYRLRRQLAETNADLEANNADLRAFTHTVAHDLKAPLSVMIGFSALLRSDFDRLSAEKVVESLDRMVRIGHKMHDIIEALLLFASVREADEVARTALDMGPIIDAALNRLATEVEARGAEVIVPETWPAALGYRPWMEEVWVNYLSNAIKYGGDADAGVAPRVELGAAGCAQSPRFFVRDNGPGLTPEERAQVFTPFTRFHRGRAEGHGLGLSIVRRIVEKLDGQVGVESAGVGRGCTFWFELPAAYE